VPEHTAAATPRSHAATGQAEPEGHGSPAQLRAVSPELQQVASDLARLQAQAEQVSDDPEGLRMRAQAALARQRECRDEACLQAWAARRRSELLAEF
jgi:outer membrane murein-binding lipoprotein Lpp